jgi:hypothetical protein
MNTALCADRACRANARKRKRRTQLRLQWIGRARPTRFGASLGAFALCEFTNRPDQFCQSAGRINHNRLPASSQVSKHDDGGKAPKVPSGMREIRSGGPAIGFPERQGKA